MEEFDHSTPQNEDDMLTALEKSILVAEFRKWLQTLTAEAFRLWPLRNDNDPED